MYTQLRQPNFSAQGQAGWCLSVQQGCWGVPHYYYSALEAWEAAAYKHTDLPPDGVDAVCYWTYRELGKDYGHIATRTADGRVFSSPLDYSYGNQWFDSLDAMTARIRRIYPPCQYIGWAEDLSGVQLLQAQALQPNQRTVSNPDGVNGRAAPDTSAPILKEFGGGDTLDFRGFVHGQDPYGQGNDIWFVGAYSETYWYSGAFSDPSANGLADLTKQPDPVPAPTPSPEPEPADDLTYHAVVNKKYPVNPTEYEPTDLVDVGNGQRLRKDAAVMLKAMQQDSGAGVLISPASGYRSYKDQEKVYNDYDAATRDTFSARPGYSEHQLGLAIDLAPIDEVFELSAACKWLTENAYKYGYILRYPKDKEGVTGYKYEPWHWRYIGTEASRMREAQKDTLEEFYQLDGGNYPDVPEKPVEPPKVVVPEPHEHYTIWQLIVAIIKKIFTRSK